MENLSGAEIARFLSLRRDLLTVLLEIHETIMQGQYILFGISQEDGMAFLEEAMQDAGMMPELIFNDKEGGRVVFESEEKEDAPPLMVLKEPTRGNLGAQTCVGDGEAGPGQEIGRVDLGVGGAILWESIGLNASVPSNEVEVAINRQVLGPGRGSSHLKMAHKKNVVEEFGDVKQVEFWMVSQEDGKAFPGDVRPREGGGMKSQEEGMPFWEEARQDVETMPKFNVDDKEGDEETVESEQKGSASSMKGIVSVTSGDSEDEGPNSGHVGNDDKGVDGGAENEDGPQLMNQGPMAIVENEQLPDMAVEDKQNKYPTLQTARFVKQESLRSKRSGKWHKRKE